jgi:prepilin-type N-terminal cleavage/methylation domain-containing protein
MKNLHKKAFSLIEISVVILIIGMLIAGISQGIDLYQDMRLATARSLTLNSRVNRIEDLTMWFEATSEKSFENPNPQNEERIALWKNINFKLSNRIDVAQATLESKPFYVRNAINNIPALRFDNGQLLTASNVKISEIVSSDQVTVFMVQNNFSGDNTTSTFGWNSGSHRFQSHAQESDRVSIDYGDTNVSGASRVSTPFLTNFLNQNKIITFVKNGSNVVIKINAAILANSSSSSATINTSLSANFSIGKYPPDDNYYFKGYVGEFIVFKKALTDAEISSIETYLSKKWAIKIN